VRVVAQRVTSSSVEVSEKIVGEIEKGLVLFLGIKNGDSEEDLAWMAEKCLNLRIFENEEGKFHYSVLEIKGEILVVSQFTLYGDCRKGRRPSFTQAAEPEIAEKLYEKFVLLLKESGLKIQTGIFASRMKVMIHNEGPVTLILDTEER
jgi:D-tyrosyl-tRNA(Tyr) deacylase